MATIAPPTPVAATGPASTLVTSSRPAAFTATTSPTTSLAAATAATFVSTPSHTARIAHGSTTASTPPTSLSSTTLASASYPAERSTQPCFATASVRPTIPVTPSPIASPTTSDMSAVIPTIPTGATPCSSTATPASSASIPIIAHVCASCFTSGHTTTTGDAATHAKPAGANWYSSATTPSLCTISVRGLSFFCAAFSRVRPCPAVFERETHSATVARRHPSFEQRIF
mmetsp:Transcript_22507/g.60361  ORF Transcript_22507/g.60361 Transcript_22507/m.60361 type:complete len:229 (-) Transcript_22507:676-1362(-)